MAAPPVGFTEPTMAFLNQAMHGAALTTLIILAAVLSSLAPKRKRSDRIVARSCKLKAGLLDQKASQWAAPLMQLQQGLLQAEKSHAGAVFQDLQELHASAACLLLCINKPSAEGAMAYQNDEVVAEVKRIRKRVQALQEGMQKFGGDIGQLFQALLALRVALLDPTAATRHPSTPTIRSA